MAFLRCPGARQGLNLALRRKWLRFGLLLYTCEASLIYQLWMDFKLKSIFITGPAASKMKVASKVTKSTQNNWLQNNGLNRCNLL
jgi:hypothetical protein